MKRPFTHTDSASLDNAEKVPSPRRRFLRLAPLLVLLAAGQPSCTGAGTGDDSSDSETGGTSSTGGSLGSGGEATTGGTGGIISPNSGGAPSGGSGSGGALGTGGVAEPSGGANGSGGDVGSGGALGTGGAEATGGSDGTGGAVGFQPCPEAGACKILPLGDSITRGFPDEDSYRVHLFELAVAGGHEITFVGTRMGGPPTAADQTFPRNHEGIDGETVQQIANRVPSPALNDMPHIILVHAGTNDLTGNNANVSSHMASLLDELISEAPDALIVVARVIPIFYMLEGVNSYNDAVEDLADERALAGAHIIVVDQFDGFPESDLGDIVHPNEGGYERMAQKWYDGIEPYLR